MTVPACTMPYSDCHNSISRQERKREPASQTTSVYLDNLRLKEQERERILLSALAEKSSVSLGRSIEQAWDRIKGNVPGVLRVPTVEIRDQREALLTWDRGVHHLDVEVTEDGLLDFFYLNRETNEAWDYVVSTKSRLPETILSRLNCFRVVF